MTTNPAILRRLLAVSVVGAAALAPMTHAAPAAVRLQVAPPVQISGDAPLASGCSAAAGNSPHAAVDPSRPGHVAVVYTAGDSVAAIAATSTDGGSSWSRTTLPGVTSCSGGSDGGFGDPMTSIGANGRTLTTVGWVTTDQSPTYPDPVRLLLNRSDDRGRTFLPPVEPEPGGSDQRGPISFAPGSDSDVLVAFERLTYVNQPQFDGQTGGFVPGTGGSIGVARSTDGGANWSTAVDAVRGGPGTDVVTVALLRSGHTVVLVYAAADETTLPAYVAWRGLTQRLYSVESHDDGRSWPTPPSLIGTYYSPRGETAGCCIPDAAVSPDGTLYVTWPHLDSSDVVSPSYDAIDVATSRDAGQTWTSFGSLRTQIGTTGGAIVEPAIAAGPHSSVGLLFYEADEAGRLTPKLAASGDGGKTWASTVLGDAFDPSAVQGGNSDGSPWVHTRISSPSPAASAPFSPAAPARLRTCGGTS